MLRAAAGAIGIGFLTTVCANHWLSRPQRFEAYGFAILLAVLARAIGDYAVFARCGLTASFWAIVLGIGARFVGVVLPGDVLDQGEFFIKIGVSLLAMDYANIVAVGGPGLVVAWVDTALVMGAGYVLTTAPLFGFCMTPQDGVVIAGATSICGSSAATAIATAIYDEDADGGGGGAKDSKNPKFAQDTIIALMGLFNTPLMPLLPLPATLGSTRLNAKVIGAWIGGSIDSTGQVIASASLGSATVLRTATVVKIAQNFLIGPVCAVLAGLFRGSFSPREVVRQFPVFIVGFFLTSAVVSALKYAGPHHAARGDAVDTAVDNSWFVAEWVNLIGFALIGLKINLRKFFHLDGPAASDAAEQRALAAKETRVLQAYVLIQALDLCTTLAFAYAMFHGAAASDDDTAAA